ncbi:MAG: hypothetical protein JHC26_05825, partial [Thermofilum sp.]|uniref:hypothetical protein n=1 Tax=Thermofilum sp. TaxID=1961369 RepID=UPI00258DB305
MASQVQAPISNENEMVESLVRRYKEIPEMLKGFFGELSGLISYLKANQDIDEERVVFLEELIRRANEYLVEKCDVIKAFKQIYGVTHTLQIVLYKYLDSALLNNHPIPAPLQTRFQRIAESMREFISFLTDVAKYYLAVGNPPLD